MTNKKIEKTITINAPLERVWNVFTDPKLTQEMGGKYVTDWKVGSDFGWMGNDGVMYTHGSLLDFKEKKLIQHNLFDTEETGEIVSIITYKFQEKDGKTLLTGIEEPQVEMDEEEYADAIADWDEALKAVKDIAEGNL